MNDNEYFNEEQIKELSKKRILNILKDQSENILYDIKFRKNEILHIIYNSDKDRKMMYNILNKALLYFESKELYDECKIIYDFAKTEYEDFGTEYIEELAEILGYKR